MLPHHNLVVASLVKAKKDEVKKKGQSSIDLVASRQNGKMTLKKPSRAVLYSHHVYKVFVVFIPIIESHHRIYAINIINRV